MFISSKLQVNFNITHLITLNILLSIYIYEQKQGNYTTGTLKSNLTVLCPNSYLFILFIFTAFLVKYKVAKL